jgi:hypothetical protein
VIGAFAVAPLGADGIGQFDGGQSDGIRAALKSTPLTSCLAGQLDFSVATGCNTTLYMVMLR